MILSCFRISGLLLAVACAPGTTAPASEPASKPEPIATPAAPPPPEPWKSTPVPAPPKLTRGTSLPAGPVAFDPSRARLAVGAGNALYFYAPDGNKLGELDAKGGVQDLAFAEDGALWVLRSDAAVRVVDGAITCTAPIEAFAILGTDASQSLHLSVRQGTELGVWTQEVRVGTDCAQVAGELEAQGPTAATSEQEWVGMSAEIGSGPKKRKAPQVRGVSGKPWKVLADRPSATLVSGIAAGAGHVLVVGDDGGWELWTEDGKKRLAQGETAPGPLVRLPGTDQVALGANLLDLTTGQLTPDALPAPAVAVSPDGTTWVLGAEGERAIWRAP